MWKPFDVTWTISEINWVIWVLFKKYSKILWYGNKVKLLRVDVQDQRFSSSRNSICNDDNVVSCSWVAWLILHLIAKSSTSKEVTFIA